jgi:hypothetical protein
MDKYRTSYNRGLRKLPFLHIAILSPILWLFYSLGRKDRERIDRIGPLTASIFAALNRRALQRNGIETCAHCDCPIWDGAFVWLPTPGSERIMPGRAPYHYPCSLVAADALLSETIGQPNGDDDATYLDISGPDGPDQPIDSEGSPCPGCGKPCAECLCTVHEGADGYAYLAEPTQPLQRQQTLCPTCNKDGLAPGSFEDFDRAMLSQDPIPLSLCPDPWHATRTRPR